MACKYNEVDKVFYLLSVLLDRSLMQTVPYVALITSGDQHIHLQTHLQTLFTCHGQMEVLNFLVFWLLYPESKASRVSFSSYLSETLSCMEVHKPATFVRCFTSFAGCVTLIAAISAWPCPLQHLDETQIRDVVDNGSL